MNRHTDEFNQPLPLGSTAWWTSTIEREDGTVIAKQTFAKEYGPALFMFDEPIVGRYAVVIRDGAGGEIQRTWCQE